MTKKAITILQGASVHHYHSVPGELDLITVSPERRAILTYLAQIGSARFPEFVLDLLIHVEGHSAIDITDGPGDEKQDILTHSPDGKRHLTQCKHTEKPAKNYSGDELDLLFAACCRKNCTSALFVTNSDLTPQGKRYITDGEYARGWQGDPSSLPSMDYWNGNRLWERVARSDVILNKWFGGMCQAHALRHFSFDLVVHRLPDGDTSQVSIDDLVNALDAENCGNAMGKPAYSVRIDDGLRFTVCEWFHTDLDLGVPFVGPETSHGLVNIPLPAFRIEATVSDDVEKYDITECRDKIVSYVGNRALPVLPTDNWWHIIAAQPKAFVFLHDIARAVVIPAAPGQAYVRIGDANVTAESGWALLPADPEFARPQAAGDDLQWQHTPTGTKILLILDQRPHPLAAYQQHIHQCQLRDRLTHCEIRVVADADRDTLDKIRHIVDPRWILMTSNRGELFWAFSPDEADGNDPVEETLRRWGLDPKRISENGRSRLVKLIDVYPPNPTWRATMSQSEIVTPVWLNRRILWLSKKVKCEQPAELKQWLALLKFKWEYEHEYGHDFMAASETKSIGSEEIRGLLCDFFTVRGHRMLDIAFGDESMTLNLRVKLTSTAATADAVKPYVAEVDKLLESTQESMQESV